MLAAGGRVGIRLTLLDACYLHGGIEPLPRRERRRVGARAWRAIAPTGGARLGAAIHSVRAVDPVGAAVVAAFAARSEAGRCTPTSPNSRPRTRAASRRTG